MTVGFVVNGTGSPTGCLVDDAKCSADDGATPEPTGRPTPSHHDTETHRDPHGHPHPDRDPHRHALRVHRRPARRPPPASRPTSTPPSTPPSTWSPTPTATGVKDYNLAFVTDGGGCTPKWGGVTDLGSDAVAAQIGALRAKGGDVRVSFGGAAGSELATDLLLGGRAGGGVREGRGRVQAHQGRLRRRGRRAARHGGEHPPREGDSHAPGRTPGPGRLVHPPRHARGPHPGRREPARRRQVERRRHRHRQHHGDGLRAGVQRRHGHLRRAGRDRHPGADQGSSRACPSPPPGRRSPSPR